MKNDILDTQWVVSPPAYLKERPAEYDGERIISRYVTVRDGTKLAVDIHLPGTDTSDGSYPAILILTPYYRRFALRAGCRNDIDDAPTIAFYRDMFVPRGYALVVVDVRGSGASFGCRDGFRSPAERLDHYDVADWVAGQDWCDGNIGATGISYPGAASDFLASTNHPAVKAVAPLFAVWDTWMNHLYPGGVLLTCVTKNYGQLAVSLDQDRRDLIPAYAYFKDEDLTGPAPVDDDTDGSQLAGALHQHRANFDMQDFAQQMRFRDAGLSDDPDYTGAKISPYHYASRDADASTAYFSVSGWMDGGGYSTGTIQRHRWLKNPDNHLMLGPWDHGARGHVSPWRASNEAQQPYVGAAVLRFFDKHLMARKTAIENEKAVHYYTMGAETWKSVDSWPPAADELSLYAAPDHNLSDGAPNDDNASDVYQADFACGTGEHTRYDRLYIQNVETYYDDWDGREDLMLSYTGAPLDSDTEVTGHPWAELHFASSEKDCTFFVYVSDITPEGKSLYVTEGVFRALHRKPGPNPTDIPATGPTHTFNKADAELLVPGEPAQAAFELLPTSYLFRAGHRIRVSIAMADTDHFTRIPDGRPPEVTLFRQADRASRVMLPIVRGN
ncbi:MAG: CocE/NonD family hydrolase [Rhodospirillaceae bacterium]|nr:CocE/NonD family hydrolase [Rhodospirillaceae bacterium]MBT6610406.1 CocE/NonD family hydrolase [Rhodospirillaceae bacterium]MBT7509325.1 CocE/NonD family hydrolase [Rhodospirillaceae bacterium]